ncbi:MAG: FKBP-type peptidyl-prolyl cis-trans isomerase [Bacteroidales bacterium]
MKKTVLLSCIFSAVLVLMSSCSNGFKKTEGGLLYKIAVKGQGEKTPKVGDFIDGILTISADDSVLFSTKGKVETLFQITESTFAGDLNEGLLLLHEGDSVIFKVNADSMRKYMGGLPEIVKGEVTYAVKVSSILDDAAMRAKQEKLAQEQKGIEEKAIAQYLQTNNITVAPTETGLYYIELQKGNGAKVSQGKKIKINYTGQLLDGTIFDTSIKEDAQGAGVYNPNRPYEPMETIAGVGQLIPGMDQALLMMSKGTKAKVIIPFSLGYGATGAGPIPPFSTLVFTFEVVSVE